MNNIEILTEVTDAAAAAASNLKLLYINLVRAVRIAELLSLHTTFPIDDVMNWLIVQMDQQYGRTTATTIRLLKMLPEG